MHAVCQPSLPAKTLFLAASAPLLPHPVGHPSLAAPLPSPSPACLQLFEEGRLETRVPLTTRTGTKDAGEIWISMRKEGGEAPTGTTGMASGMGATGVQGPGYETSERADAYEREEGYERTGTREGYGAAVPASTTGEYNMARQGEEVVCGQEFFTKVDGRAWWGIIGLVGL